MACFDLRQCNFGRMVLREFPLSLHVGKNLVRCTLIPQIFYLYQCAPTSEKAPRRSYYLQCATASQPTPI